MRSRRQTTASQSDAPIKRVSEKKLYAVHVYIVVCSFYGVLRPMPGVFFHGFDSIVCTEKIIKINKIARTKRAP